MKAFIRGEIISYTAYEKKLRKEKLEHLAKRISQLDTAYTSSLSIQVHKERLSLQAEFDVMMSQYTIDLLLQSGAKCYKQGDKASKLLAHQLHRVASSHLIPQIETDAGKTTDPSAFNIQRLLYFTLFI
ncbi:hypothetical protein LDENG_00036760 [Lucifuga dentata]|nr:hypothetical protein LDENG_00036760 [Lucifuga dentata]